MGSAFSSDEPQDPHNGGLQRRPADGDRRNPAPASVLRCPQCGLTFPNGPTAQAELADHRMAHQLQTEEFISTILAPLSSFPAGLQSVGGGPQSVGAGPHSGGAIPLRFLGSSEEAAERQPPFSVTIIEGGTGDSDTPREPQINAYLRMRQMLHEHLRRTDGMNSISRNEFTPLPRDVLNSLPTIEYSTPAASISSDNETSCRICLDEYKKGDKVRRLPCLHFYHKQCIDEWFERSQLCPVCKYPAVGQTHSSSETSAAHNMKKEVQEPSVQEITENETKNHNNDFKPAKTLILPLLYGGKTKDNFSYDPYSVLGSNETFISTDFIQTGSGNKVAVQSILCGSHRIHMAGRSIIFPGAVLRGDVASLRIGRYVAVGPGTSLLPAMKTNTETSGEKETASPATHVSIPITIGDFVQIGADCVISAAIVGATCIIGDQCVLGNRCIIRDSSVLLPGTVVPDDMVIPAMSVYSGAPGDVHESAMLIHKVRAQLSGNHKIPPLPL